MEFFLVFKDPEETGCGRLHSQRACSLAVERQKSLFSEKSVPEGMCLARNTAQSPLPEPEQVQEPRRTVRWVQNFL